MSNNQNIQKLRLSEKNKILNDISTIKKNIQRTEKSIYDLTHNNTIRDVDFLRLRTAENKKNLDDYNQKLDELNEKLSVIDQGGLDEVIDKEVKKNTQKVIKKLEDDKRKQEVVKKEEEENKKVSKKFGSEERTEKYSQKQKFYEMRRDFDRMCQIEQELPDYIRDNLRSMPANKGYVWRGVWFFGEKPAEKGPVVMFEKQREITYIHEIYPEEHVIYKKIGRDPKQLYSKTIRKQYKLPTFFI